MVSDAIPCWIWLIYGGWHADRRYLHTSKLAGVNSVENSEYSRRSIRIDFLFVVVAVVIVVVELGSCS